MSKQWKWGISFAGVILLGGLVLAWVARRQVEPTFQGHTLYEWLCTYDSIIESVPLRDHVFNDPARDPAAQEAAAAIRQIGTNATTSLLTWISYGQSPLKTRYLDSVRQLQQTRFGRWIPEAYRIDWPRQRARVAVKGFGVLGAQAQPGCPALARLANSPRREVADRAMDALIKIGPVALPSLVSILTNTTSTARVEAAKAIAGFGSSAEPALPALLECVSDKDELVAVYAAVALSQLPSRHESVVQALTSTWNDPRTTVRFGFIRTLAWHTPRSEVVLPVLTIALNDPNPDVRREATNAILQIAPEILTNVPAK